MDQRREALLNFVKDALQRGYGENQVRQNLLDNGISWIEAGSLFSIARAELGLQKPQEDISIDYKGRLPAWIIILLGIVAMCSAYIYRLINPELLDFSNAGFLNSIWPMGFPLISNLITFVFFRKRFLVGFIITWIVIVLLLGIVLGLAAIGI